MTTKIYAVAPDDVPDEARGYITPGKRYPLVPNQHDCGEHGLSKSGDGFAFRDDEGDVWFALWEGSSHLSGGNWTRLDVDEPDTLAKWEASK